MNLELGEETRSIAGFPNYYITSFGNVFSAPNHRNREYHRLLPNLIKGYYRVSLCREGKRFNRRIHTLVAQAFIPNPEGKPTVNHIHGDQKTNNRVDNLEWATSQEQAEHMYSTGLWPLSEDWGIMEDKRPARNKPYRVRLTLPGTSRLKSFGCFATKEEALTVRDQTCLEHNIIRNLKSP